MLAEKDLDALMLELIREFLKVPAIQARLVVRELVAQIFVAFEGHRCEYRRCARVYLGDDITSVGPHADHGAFYLLAKSLGLLVPFRLIREALRDLSSSTPDEIIEGLLASHHLGDISAIQAVNAVGAHQAFLPLLDIAFFGELVSGLMVHAEASQVVLVYRAKKLVERFSPILGCCMPVEVVVADLLAVLREPISTQR